MISLQNVSVKLGNKEILQDISFTLDDGRNLIILGKSGSGKTVLIKTIIGLFAPEHGRIQIDGIDTATADKAIVNGVMQKISMVFQNAALIDSFTVFQNVALPLYEREQHTDEEIHERVQQCLELVGLTNILDLYPSELSGGMRKRVGIARALIYEPKYIIFDEPISGLDPVTADEILFYMSEIIRTQEITTITITHDLQNLKQIGDTVLFVNAGRAEYYDSIEQFSNSNDPAVKEFIR